MSLPELTSEEFIDFFAALRLHGYEISTQQCITAQKLIITLAATGNILEEQPEKLGTLLAPIICTSPGEQESFYRIFDRWLTQRPTVLSKIKAAENPLGHNLSNYRSSLLKATTASQLKALIRPLIFLWSHRRPLAFIVLGLAVAILTSFLWTKYLSVNTPTLTANQPQVPGNVNQVSWSELISSFNSRWGKWLFGASTLLVIALILWKVNRKSRLKKRHTRQRPHIENLTVRGAGEQLSYLLDLRRTSQELRRYKQSNVIELDVHSTIDETLRRGLFTPAYRARKSMPEYLVLIDRASFHDQMARLEDEIIESLIRSDVYIERFYFQGDPRICRRNNPKAPNFTVQDLAQTYPKHNLVIFSTGDGLFDQLTKQPHKWLGVFAHWNYRVLLTPDIYGDTYRDQVLSEVGFVVLPATRLGLAAMSGMSGLTGRQDSVAEHRSQLMPRLLRERPGRWLEEYEPSQITLDELCRQLKHFLGAEGYNWLSACAVYPMLYWDLTLYLGLKLTGQEQLYERLLMLVRLPWFQYGSIPDWLRRRLISELPRESELRIRNSLEDLLKSAISPQKGFALPIALESKIEEEHGWKGFTRGIKSKVREWRARARLRRAIEAEPEGSPLQEHVFLSFMSGFRRNKLTILVPAEVRSLLLRQDIGVGELYFLNLLLIGSLASVLLLSIYIGLSAGTATALPIILAIIIMGAVFYNTQMQVLRWEKRTPFKEREKGSKLAVKIRAAVVSEVSKLVRLFDKAYNSFIGLLDRFTARRQRESPSLVTNIVRGVKYAFISACALITGYLSQTNNSSLNELLILAIPISTSVFFFICYASRFHFTDTYVKPRDILETALQKEALLVFPFIETPVIGVILLFISRYEPLPTNLLIAFLSYGCLFISYGIFLARYRTPEGTFPSLRHRLIWPVVLSIAIGLYLGMSFSSLRASLWPLIPVASILFLYLTSEMFMWSKKQFLGMTLLSLLAVTIIVTLGFLNILPVPILLTQYFSLTLFCVAVSAYLAVFEAWKLTANLAEVEVVDRQSTEHDNQFDDQVSKSTQYAVATLIILAGAIWILPFYFIFSDFGSVFLLSFAVHALGSFVFWFYFGKDKYLLHLPWELIKNVAGLLFLGILVISTLFRQPITFPFMKGFASWTGLSIVLFFAAYPVTNLSHELNRLRKRSIKYGRSITFQLLENRVNITRLLCLLCVASCFMMTALLQAVNESSQVFYKAELAFQVYWICILFCFMFDVIHFFGRTPTK